MKENLGFGHLGNGVTVWDRTREDNGDYLTVAHISYDRTVSYYVKDISKEDKAKIERFAKFDNMRVSATQDGFVLQPVLPLRFLYDNSGYCRDIYVSKKGNKYCRMEDGAYVSWYSVTPDYEEPLCRLHPDVLIQIIDKDDNILVIEQNQKKDENYFAEKRYPFSWEEPDDNLKDIYNKVYQIT